MVRQERPLLLPPPPDTADANVVAYNLATHTRTTITDPDDDADQDLPRVSAGRVVYMDHSETDTEIYMYDLGTGVRTRITNNSVDDVGPDIDGNLIAWLEGVVPPMYIRYYDVERGVTGTVPGTAHPNGVRVDRGRIVYYDDADGQFDVFVYNPLITDLAKVPNLTTTFDIGTPVMHGDAVAYTRWPHVDNTLKDIWASDLRSGTTGAVTVNAARQQYPALFGRMLAWQDDRNGADDIFVWNQPEGPGYDVVTNALGDQPYPEMFGNRIVYQDNGSTLTYNNIGMATAPYAATRLQGRDRYKTAIATRPRSRYRRRTSRPPQAWSSPPARTSRTRWRPQHLPEHSTPPAPHTQGILPGRGACRDRPAWRKHGIRDRRDFRDFR